jgi:carbon-monoxide dehydrogenase small subunit
MAAQVSGAEILTIEGLADGDRLHPVQEGFIDKGGVQCGFCIPGMVMSATALLEKNPEASLDYIKAGLSGNLCRCTGYEKIFRAVEQARDRTAAKKAPPVPKGTKSPR